ncbi:MAG: hypothetical protein N2322_03530, partial [Terrimicrobiaceae bacterium]|nr:hypothetical protein [Terrimicrobiaceae bacterium]
DVYKRQVLFLPVGGRMSSAAQERLLASTRPRLIIPMGPSGEAAAWAARFGPVHRVPGTRLLINRETLPHTPTAILLPAP